MVVVAPVRSHLRTAPVPTVAGVSCQQLPQQILHHGWDVGGHDEIILVIG